MKPHVLLLLLLAIPPLICNILASENAEKSDAAPTLSSDSSAKPVPAPAKDSPAAAVAIAPTPAVKPSAPAKSISPAPAPHSGAAAGLKAWFMLW
jgi:hypothetical protein